jgi:hypothetical protein
VRLKANTLSSGKLYWKDQFWLIVPAYSRLNHDREPARTINLPYITCAPLFVHTPSNPDPSDFPTSNVALSDQTGLSIVHCQCAVGATPTPPPGFDILLGQQWLPHIMWSLRLSVTPYRKDRMLVSLVSTVRCGCARSKRGISFVDRLLH